ncbi:hypothetical protein Taro_056944 [Colocasia esculenta]|uniref:BZIP domain-containing protein n=1 Tax=Colocasia esculenta TaxID=4460 RepID=A0A843XXM8_COLES|nr:hypothetical protein [Colocasia esculenta]
MSPIVSEILLSGFMINSTLRRRTHLVQSFSVVFLYWFYNYLAARSFVFPPLQDSHRSMASSSGSGASSGSTTQLTNSGSEWNLHVMDQRKRKRMLSNRESARRSRLRKEKHLDDLTAQVTQLRKENNQVLTSYNLTTQQYLAVESENSVLRTQIMELGNRLQSLNEILQHMNGGSSSSGGFVFEDMTHPEAAIDGFFMNNPWSLTSVGQPIMASADMLQY